MTQHHSNSIERLPTSVSVITDVFFYLIKLYSHNSQAIFGTTVNGHLEFTSIGRIATDEWVRSAYAYSGIELDEWLIMPNHLEGIVSIREPLNTQGYTFQSSKPRSLSSFVASYKAAAAKRINLLRNAPGSSVWQRGYQERLIPDETILDRTRQSISRQNSINLQNYHDWQRRP